MTTSRDTQGEGDSARAQTPLERDLTQFSEDTEVTVSPATRDCPRLRDCPRPLRLGHARQLAHCGKVRKTPSWPRSWANFSLLSSEATRLRGLADHPAAEVPAAELLRAGTRIKVEAVRVGAAGVAAGDGAVAEQGRCAEAAGRT
jgi:hypothetical protein